MKATLAGLTASDLHLSVHVEVSEGAWCKYAVVKVPLPALLHPEITDALDRCVRRRLTQVWSETSQDDMFPGMPG